MTHTSYTLKINSLPTNAKLIPHGTVDKVQELKNHKFNLETIKITDKIIKNFPKATITWCLDGCIVITTKKSDLESKKIFKTHQWDIQTEKNDIKHEQRDSFKK